MLYIYAVSISFRIINSFTQFPVNYPYGKKFDGDVSLRLTAKCPYGEVSVRQSSYGKVSYGEKSGNLEILNSLLTNPSLRVFWGINKIWRQFFFLWILLNP